MRDGREEGVCGGLVKTKNYGYKTKPYVNLLLYKLTKNVIKQEEFKQMSCMGRQCQKIGVN